MTRRRVAANASLGIGPRAYSLRLLADGHLAAGSASDGVQLFAYGSMTHALLDSWMEVAANTSKPYYKTNAYTDYALKFLDETQDDGKPFFLYMAYESAHYPIQALEEDYARFDGRYAVGWDAIRQKW